MGILQNTGSTSGSIQQSSQTLSAQARSSVLQPDQTWFDATVGAAEYGAADVGGLLLKNIGQSFDIEYANELASDLDAFKINHPEYAPTKVDDVWGLISNPKAVVSRVAGMAPYMLATVGGAAIPVVGIPLTAGLVYGVESERSYEQAKMDGASEQEALAAGRLGGAVNTILQILPGTNVLKYAKGARAALAEEAISSGVKQVMATKAGESAAGLIAKNTLLNMIQGGANELIPLGVYGKEVDPGFIDRRLQDAVGGLAAHAVFAAGAKGFGTLVGPDGQVAQEGQTQGKVTVRNVDSWDVRSSVETLKKQGYDEGTAGVLAQLYDARATMWGVKNQAPKEEFYAQYPITQLAPAEHVRDVAEGSEGSKTTKTEAAKPPEQAPPTSQGVEEFGQKVMDAFGVEKGVEEGSSVQETHTEQAKTAGSKQAVHGTPNLDQFLKNQPPGMKDTIDQVVDNMIKTNRFDLFVNKQLAPEDHLKINAYQEVLKTKGYELFDEQHNPSTGTYQAKIKKEQAQTTTSGVSLSAETKAAVDQALAESDTRMAVSDTLDHSVDFNYDDMSTRGGQNGKQIDAVKALRSLFSVFREGFTSDEEALINGLYPQKKSKIPAEEKLARAFVRWVREGDAPDASLISTFKDAREWIRRSYGTLKQAGIQVKLSQDGRMFFDNLLFEDTSTIRQQRVYVKRLATELALTRKAPKGDTGNEFGGRVDEVKAELNKASRELQRMKEARWSPTELTDGQKAEEQEREKFRFESEQQRKERTKTQERMDWWSSLVSMMAPLNRTSAGKKLGELLTDAQTDAKGHVGKWVQPISEAWNALTSEDVKWMMKEDVPGISNLMAIGDHSVRQDVTPPESVNAVAVQKFVQTLGQINRYFGSLAEDAGIMQKRKDGAYVPFEQPEGQRIPRIIRAEARQALLRKSGAFYRALVDRVLELNPELGDFSGAARALDHDFADSDLRKSGSLEYTRQIKVLPATVEVRGSKVAVMHLNPLEIAQRSVENQATRLEFVKRMGQATLEDVTESQLRKLGKILGVENMSVGKQELTEQVKSFVMENGLLDQQEVDGLPFHQLKDLAKWAEIPVKMSKGELTKQILESSPDLGTRDLGRLRRMAKELGGIKLEQDAPQLLNDIKQRVSSKVNDTLDVLRKAHIAEGGDLKDFEAVLKVAQGLPYGWLGDHAVPAPAKFVSNVLGAMQTSLAAIPNAFQTAIQVPQLLGMKNYLTALQSVMTSPESIRDAMTLNTGIHRQMLSWQADPGYSLQNLGRVVREAVSKGTLVELLNERNAMIAFEAGRLKAEQWKNEGISKEELPQARTLGLTSREIERLNDGLMTPDEWAHVHRKIIQEAVGKTQFMNERAQNKGKLENVPILRMLFSYNSYILGTTRANYRLVGDLKSAVQSGDVASVWEGTKRLSTLVAGSMGAGMASQLLRQALKGQAPSQVDDSFWDRAFAALNESAALGMVNRVSDSFKYDNGVIQKTAFGMTPQVSALLELFGTLAGHGRLGDLPLGEKGSELLKKQAPVIRAFSGWMDQAANPELQPYLESKALSSRFKRDALGAKGTAGDEPINPDYLHVFERVERGDLDGAREMAVEFYKRKIKEGEDPHDQVDKLRSSLTGRSPLNLGRENLIKFLVSLPQDMRRKVMKSQLKYMAVVNAVAPQLSS